MSKSSQKYSSYDEVPYYRKHGFFWLMWFLCTPVALGILLFGDVYYKKKDVYFRKKGDPDGVLYKKEGEVKSFGLINRIIAGFMAPGWLCGIVVSIIDSIVGR